MEINFPNISGATFTPSNYVLNSVAKTALEKYNAYLNDKSSEKEIGKYLTSQEMSELQQYAKLYGFSSTDLNDKNVVKNLPLLLERDRLSTELKNMYYSSDNALDTAEVKKLIKDYENAQKLVENVETARYNAVNESLHENVNQTTEDVVFADEGGKYSITLTSEPIDIEGMRYADSPYAKRIGYTLLTCGSYSSNVYNNGLIGNDNPTNCISFILPMPEGAISFETSANWNEDDEGGMNEAAAAMVSSHGGKTSTSNGGSITTSGVGKSLLSAATEMLGKFGVEGAMRGAGIAYNPNKQLYFKGVDLSSLSFDFKLTPKSNAEAIKIKQIVEAINLLMLPGTSSGGSNINALSEIAKNLYGNAKQSNEGKGILDSIVSSVGGGIFDAFGTIGSLIGTDNLSSPYFSYPGLWTIGVYVTRSGKSDFPVFEHTRLAMTSCSLNIGGSNGLTWHSDGFPTTMTISLGFNETQYRTKENMFNLLKLLGNPNDSLYKDAVITTKENLSNLSSEKFVNMLVE